MGRLQVAIDMRRMWRLPMLLAVGLVAGIFASASTKAAWLVQDDRLTLQAAALDGVDSLALAARKLAAEKPNAMRAIALETLTLAAEREAFLDPSKVDAVAVEAVRTAERRKLFDGDDEAIEMMRRIREAAAGRMLAFDLDLPGLRQTAQADFGAEGMGSEPLPLPRPSTGTRPGEGSSRGTIADRDKRYDGMRERQQQPQQAQNTGAGRSSQDVAFINREPLRRGWLPFAATGLGVAGGLALASGINAGGSETGGGTGGETPAPGDGGDDVGDDVGGGDGGDDTPVPGDGGDDTPVPGGGGDDTPVPGGGGDGVGGDDDDDVGGGDGGDDTPVPGGGGGDDGDDLGGDPGGGEAPASARIVATGDRFSPSTVLDRMTEERQAIAASFGRLMVAMVPDGAMPPQRARFAHGIMRSGPNALVPVEREQGPRRIELSYGFDQGALGQVNLTALHRHRPHEAMGVSALAARDEDADPLQIKADPMLALVEEGSAAIASAAPFGDVTFRFGAFGGQAADVENGFGLLRRSARIEGAFGEAVWQRERLGVTIGGGALRETGAVLGLESLVANDAEATTRFLSSALALDIDPLRLVARTTLGQTELAGWGRAAISAWAIAGEAEGIVRPGDRLSLGYERPLRLEGSLQPLIHGDGQEQRLQGHYAMPLQAGAELGGAVIYRVDPGHDPNAADDLVGLVSLRQAF